MSLKDNMSAQGEGQGGLLLFRNSNSIWYSCLLSRRNVAECSVRKTHLFSLLSFDVLFVGGGFSEWFVIEMSICLCCSWCMFLCVCLSVLKSIHG